MLKKLIIIVLLPIIFFALFYTFWFMRLPERNIPPDESVFVSPANGTVVSVLRVKTDTLQVDKGIFGYLKTWVGDVDKDVTFIGIQMNPANVHYQRLPQSATLLSKSYNRGKFNNAIISSNSFGIRFENENNQLLFQTTSGTRFKLIQISGFVARKIEDYIEADNKYQKGHVIGMIKLGSQVVVILDSNYVPTVDVGTSTIEGETVIAKQVPRGTKN